MVVLPDQGEVTIEICMYEISKSKLQRTAVTSIPLQTQVCCQSLSPDNEKLMLGCIDGSVVIFDEGRGITHLVKAAFVSVYRFASFFFEASLTTSSPRFFRYPQ